MSEQGDFFDQLEDSQPRKEWPPLAVVLTVRADGIESQWNRPRTRPCLFPSWAAVLASVFHPLNDHVAVRRVRA